MNRLSEQEIRRFWGIRAESWYLHDNVDGDFILNIQHHLAPYILNLRLNDRVLDLAAGANNAVYYPENFDMSRVTALDITPEMLRRNPSGQKILADASNGLDFPDSSFGGVISVFGMRYLRNQEYVLFESVRVVRPGAWVTFVDFDKGSIPTEVREFNANQLVEVAQSNGLNATSEVLYKPYDNRRYAQLNLLAIQKPY